MSQPWVSVVWSPWVRIAFFSCSTCNAGVAGTCSFLNPHQKAVSSEQEYWHILCMRQTSSSSASSLLGAYQPFSLQKQYYTPKKELLLLFFPGNINFSRTKNSHRGKWSWSVLAMSFVTILMEICSLLRLWLQLRKLYTKKYSFGVNNSCQCSASGTRKHQDLNCSIVLICHRWM